MASTTDTQPTAAPLEQELEELRLEEQQLEQRTGRVELSNGLALVFSIFALLLAVVAVAVAFLEGGKSTNSGSNAASTSAGTATPAVAGGMGSANQGAMGGMAAGAPGTVNVALGDMWVRPSVASVPAGKVTFRARNMGHLTHELMIERMPIKLSSPGQPVEDAAQGMVADMQPGGTGKMTLRLKPGKYELFCNVSGHYAAGQHTVFTVTG